jgi:hypothetical protein
MHVPGVLVSTGREKRRPPPQEIQGNRENMVDRGVKQRPHVRWRLPCPLAASQLTENSSCWPNKGHDGRGCRGCGHDDRCHGGVGVVRVMVMVDMIIMMTE